MGAGAHFRLRNVLAVEAIRSGWGREGISSQSEPKLAKDRSEPEARLWEIAENLHRADLTVQERSEHVAEWIRLTDEKLAQLGPVSTRGRTEGRAMKAALM